MAQDINSLLEIYVENVRKLYGNHLRKVILYGSYARGDNGPDPDIDLMILVDLLDTEIQQKGHRLSDITFDYNFEYDLGIMPIVKNQDHFTKWLRAYPFYHNIHKEGVEIYAA